MLCWRFDRRTFNSFEVRSEGQPVFFLFPLKFAQKRTALVVFDDYLPYMPSFFLRSRECCLPLLRHCLDSEGVRDNADSARLLKVLLSVAITSPSPLLGDGTSPAAAEMRSPLKSPGKARGKGKDKGTPAKTTPISKTPTLVFQCNAAEVLVHRCLRTSGQIRTFTLQALGSLRSSSASVFEVTGGVDGGEKESTRQRTKLLSTLVDVGLLGADAGLIAAAASALDVTPEDVVVLVGELVPSEKSGNAKVRAPLN